MMKINNQLLILFLTGLCSVMSCSQAQTTITIHSVDIDLMTSARVKCDQLNEYFGDKVKSYRIKENDSVKIVQSFLKSLEPIDENYAENPDTRIIIEISKDGETISACIGYLVVQYEEISYKNTDEFREYLSSLPSK